MKMKKRKYTKLYVSMGLIVLCALAIAIVTLLRSPEAAYVGEDAYFNLRIAESPSLYDGLSYGGRFTAYSFGLPFLLSFNPGLIAMLLPFLLGILSFIVFSQLLKEFGFEWKNLALLVLVASPTFIYTFSTLNKYMLPVFLAMLGLFLMLKKSKLTLLAVPVFAIMPFFSLAISLIALFLLLLLTAYKAKERMWLYYIILFATIFVGALYYGFMIKNAGFEWLRFAAESKGFNAQLQFLISDMGSLFGLGVFGLVIAAIGIISGWKKKYKDLFIFFSVFALAIIMFFRIEALFFLNFFVAAFAAKGFMHLWIKRWESRILKNFIILTLVCGLIFSVVSSTSRTIQALPDEGIVQGMGYLNGLPDGTVFSDYSRGFWINYAGKKNVMDGNFRFAPEVNERWHDSQELFYTRDWENATAIISKYDISYFWIDKEMKDKVWEEDDEGLLFLLKYSKEIQKVYDRQGVEIWEVSK